MQRKTRFKIALVLAVPLVLALVTVGYALWTDAVTRLEIAKHVRNAWCGVSLPQWQILQEESAKSIQWMDYAPNPRFAIYDAGMPGNETDDAVLDKETALVWARDADLFGGKMQWQQAIDFCRNLTLADRAGWRVPAIEELSSLFPLPSQHPFFNVHPDLDGQYWSYTTYESDNTLALRGESNRQNVVTCPKNDVDFLIPVRGH